MNKRFLSIIFGLVLTLSIYLYPKQSYAAEYSGASGTWHISNGYTIIADVYYTPTVNDISTKTYIKIINDSNGNIEDYPNAQGYYSFNGGTQTNWAVYPPLLPSEPWDKWTNAYFSSLTPNTKYTFLFGVVNAGIAGWSQQPDTGTYPWYKNFNLYTDPVKPYNLTAPSYGQTAISIQWSNGANPTTTNYTLERSLSASMSSPTTVTSGNNLTSVNDSGLNSDTTYYYRVRVNAVSGRSYYSDVYPVTTTLDPTLGAARAAKNAAEAAMNAAQQAKTSADAAAANTTYNGKSAAEWAAIAAQAIQTMQASRAIPKIKVIVKTPFEEAVDGEFGDAAGITISGVTAKTTAGDGYTVVSGTASTFITTGIKSITIGLQKIIFKVISAPSISTIATVTFN